MKHFLRNLLLRNPSATFYWILIALAGRLAYYLLELHFMGEVGAPKGVWGIYYDDTYFEPVSNLIKTGHYLPDERMPGLAVIYLPLILLFSVKTALNIFILLQVLLSAVAVYALAISARRLFKHIFFFYAVFYLYLLSPFTAISDSSPASESFCTSLLIFSVYFLINACPDGTVRGLESKKKRDFFLSGIAITWASFIRPAFFPLVALFAAILVVQALRSKTPLLRFLLIFLAPFIICEGAWIARNYMLYNRFIPATKYEYLSSCKDSYRLPIWDLERAWGLEDWRIDWLTEKDSSDISKEKVDLRYVVYTSAYNDDSLRALKKFINKASTRYAYRQNGETFYVDSVSPRDSKIIEDKCNRYMLSIKTEKPFHYYVLSRFYMIKDFLELSIFGNFQEPYMRILGIILYYFVLFSGIVGIFPMTGSFLRLKPNALFVLIPLYTIFIHTIVLRLAQNRYLIPVYPFLVVCAVYTLYLFYSRFIKRGQHNGGKTDRI